MAIIDNILGLREEEEKRQLPVQDSWVKELISQRYQPKTERIKRNPVGFEFKRDPFDPSSYYKDLGSFRDISRGATNVVMQEAANKEEAQRQREWEENQAALQNALGGVDPQFTGGDGSAGEIVGRAVGNTKYRLGPVSSNTAKAASYFGNRYGIRTIGGYRDHGSVPGSDHPKGRGLDYMINNIKNGNKVGTALANDVIKNANAWNVKYVIWNRYIWHPGRGWKRYNGPSPHTDHVHVSFKK